MVLAPAVLPHFGWFVATRLSPGTAGPVPGRGLHDGHRGRLAGARRSGAGGRHRGILDLDRPRSAVGRARRIRSRVARGAADGRWVRASRHRSAGRGDPGRSGQPAVGAERAAARPGCTVLAMLALSLTLFAAPGAVMGYLVPLLEHVTGVSGPAGEHHPGGVRHGQNVAGSFLGGRLADANAARPSFSSRSVSFSSSAVLFLGRAQPLVAVAASSPGRCSASAPASVQHRSMSLAGRRLPSSLHQRSRGLHIGRTVRPASLPGWSSRWARNPRGRGNGCRRPPTPAAMNLIGQAEGEVPCSPPERDWLCLSR